MVNFIRRAFCKHDYELIENIKFGNFNESEDPDKVIPTERLKIYRCKKCGHVQKVSTKETDYAWKVAKWIFVTLFGAFTVGYIKSVIKR